MREWEVSALSLVYWFRKRNGNVFWEQWNASSVPFFSFPFFFTLSPVFPLKWTSGFTVNPVSSLGEKTGIIKLYLNFPMTYKPSKSRGYPRAF